MKEKCKLIRICRCVPTFVVFTALSTGTYVEHSVADVLDTASMNVLLSFLIKKALHWSDVNGGILYGCLCRS